MYKEGIIQIIARQNWVHGDLPLAVKDEIWGLSNSGKLYQFNPANGDWVLKAQELD